jgi:ankyrin repeat protein
MPRKTAGHLDMVKLLVERGADFHATWRGVNAVTQADLYGKVDVREYLRSLGAKDIRETTSLNYPAAHQLILETMTKSRGHLGEWSKKSSAATLSCCT